MKLIFGLGNPGKEYEDTRHNVGFFALDRIKNFLEEDGNDLSDFSYDKSTNSEISEGKINEEKVLLVKPQTYMNNSGKAVRSFVDFYKLNPEKDIVVIYDDIDIPLGEVRTTGTSSGGHKGLQSIIDHLNTVEVKRIRVGIQGKSKEEIEDTADYVLKKLGKKEIETVNKASRDIYAVIKELLS